MEKVMKRILVALAAIGLTASLGAYAAMPTGAQVTEVNVPQARDGFFMGASALYWQSAVSGNDLDYAAVQTFPNLNNNTDQKIHNVDPEYNWGFNVFAGYDFGNGTDMQLEYLRLHTNDSESTHVGAQNSTASIAPARYFATNPFNLTFNNLLHALGEFSGDLSPFDSYKSAEGKSEINLDQVDFTIGQYFNLGCADQLRLFAGLRYTKLIRELDTWYSQDPNDANNQDLDSDGVGFGGVTGTNGALTGDDESYFTGTGPLIGLSNSYYLGYGIGFTTSLDTGLLIGKVDDELTLVNYQQDLNEVQVDSTTTTIHSDDARRIVPVMDAKLGLDYTYPMQIFGSLTLEVGWNFSHYWNAIDNLGGGASSNDALGFSPGAEGPITLSAFGSGTTHVTPTHHTADIGYQGPYVTLTFRATPTI
jgi:hypothetical protein